LTILAGPLRRSKKNKLRFSQKVTIFNTNNIPIQGFFALVLRGLPNRKNNRIRLLTGNGFAPDGSPFISTNLAAGQLSSFQGITFDLEFRSVQGKRPTFSFQLLEGGVS
jgi:hypothetical protein